MAASKKSKPTNVHTVPQEYLDKFVPCINREKFIEESCINLKGKKKNTCKINVSKNIDKIINKGLEAAIKKCINSKLNPKEGELNLLEKELVREHRGKIKEAQDEYTSTPEYKAAVEAGMPTDNKSKTLNELLFNQPITKSE